MIYPKKLEKAILSVSYVHLHLLPKSGRNSALKLSNLWDIK